MEGQDHILTVNAGGTLTIKARNVDERNAIVDGIKALCRRKGLIGDMVSYEKQA